MRKLSIITVNFNNKDGLAKTAESVIAQTWGDYEWIIIDGGSDDGSTDVIKEYVKKSGKVAYWCSEEDGGIYFGMNKGIAKASGEYCYFLNSGDYLSSPASLEKFWAYGFDEDIVFGDMMTQTDRGGCVTLKFSGGRARPSALIYGFLPHHNMFTRTELLKACGGYRTDLRIVSDWAHYTAAICVGGATYRYVPLALAVNQPAGLSGSARHWRAHKTERRRVVCELFPAWRRFCYIFSIASLRSKVGGVVCRLGKMLGHRES
jgi:glycosyltransferase involved in cell wall biosynthesis